MIIINKLHGPPLNLGSMSIKFSDLLTEREKSFYKQMSAIVLGATVVGVLALAGVTVLLTPEILITACVIGGIALLVLAIKVPINSFKKSKYMRLEKKVARLVHATQQENITTEDFNEMYTKLYDTILNLTNNLQGAAAAHKLKELTTVLLVFKNIAKAQEHLKIAGKQHEAIHFLAQAAVELNNNLSIDTKLQTDLIYYINALSSQITPLIKNKIIEVSEGIHKEFDSMPTDILEVCPSTTTELSDYLNQQRDVLDILKCIEIGKNVIKKSQSNLSSKDIIPLSNAYDETKKTLIYLSDAESNLKKPSLQHYTGLLSPVIIEMQEVLDGIHVVQSSQQNKLSSSTTKIQKRWRSHFRKKLLKNNQTYEDWRIQVADRIAAEKNLAVFPAALKRKEMYSNTHIVFTHGQSAEVSVLNDLIQVLIKTFTPEKYHRYGAGFRIPELVPKADNLDEFFSRHPISFIDDKINIELLSVDPYFYNQDITESARYFYTQNSNISKNVRSRAHTLLHHYLNQNNICQKLAQRIEAIALRKNLGGGVFYTIGIPKVVINDPKRNYAYRSHAFGRPCKCHPPEDNAKILDDLQKDTPHPCSSSSWRNPQYRLVTSAFNRDPSVRTFAFSAHTKTELEQFRREIQYIVLELHVYARLINLTTPPSEEERALLSKDIKTLMAIPNFDQSMLTPLLAQKQALFQIES